MSSDLVRRSAGAPSRSQVKALAKNSAASNDQMYMINNYDPNVGNNFPIRPFEQDPKDTRVQMINDLQSQGRISAARPLPYTEWEMDYYMKKAQQEQYADFDSWIPEYFDLTDIAQVQMLRQIVPDYFARRDDLIDEQAGLIKDVAKIRNRGFTSFKDLMTLYQIQRGQLTLPAGPLYEPNIWLDKQRSDPATVAKIGYSDSIPEFNRNAYQYGLFNPAKPMAVLQGARAPNPYNPADPLGMPGTNHTGPGGARVPSNNNWALQYAMPGGPGYGREYARGSFKTNEGTIEAANPYARSSMTPQERGTFYRQQDVRYADEAPVVRASGNYGYNPAGNLAPYPGGQKFPNPAGLREFGNDGKLVANPYGAGGAFGNANQYLYPAY